MTTYLVQNIETFETINTFTSEAAFDAWMDNNGRRIVTGKVVRFLFFMYVI